ncbi:type II secretion system protein GspM [Thiofaba sp. EF100]|uniref:type II secretion system protein GspM n=1 Tax=Thiofaba sp. EF100 TaxID=3121274 RepID=UPI003221E93A
MRTLRPAESRALALVLLALVLAGLYVVLVQPLVAAYRDNRERIDELALRLAHSQRLAMEQPALEAEHARLLRSRPAGGYYLTSQSEALATAELQGYVKRLIESSGGGLVSIQLIPPSSADARRRIKAQVRMQGNMAVVRAVLHGLESGSPWLLVDDVDLMQGRVQGVRRTAATEGAGQLEVSFNLTGFMRGAGS